MHKGRVNCHQVLSKLRAESLKRLLKLAQMEEEAPSTHVFQGWMSHRRRRLEYPQMTMLSRGMKTIISIKRIAKEMQKSSKKTGMLTKNIWVNIGNSRANSTK